MKRLLFSAALLCSISMAGFAQDESFRKVFQAPAVSSTGSWVNAEQGDIIFVPSSSTAGAFYGYSGSTGLWQNLSAASTDAGPSTPGIVNTTTQTFAGAKTFSDIATGTSIARFEQTSALANKDDRGLMAPAKGQTSVTLTSGAISGTPPRAVAIYYQDQDGNHRLRFNFTVNTSPTIRTAFAPAISGITTPAWIQAISAAASVSGAALQTYATIDASTNTLNIQHASNATTVYYISGDIELASRPTWAM